MTGIPKEPVAIVIDFHNCPYYGEKGVRASEDRAEEQDIVRPCIFTLDLVRSRN